MWADTYRPVHLAEVKGQENVISLLRLALEKKETTHLLLYGPPGTGKTSTAHALCQDLYPDPLCRSRMVLDLDASIETSVSVVKQKIKDFCKRSSPSAQFKIVLLDEADSLPLEAQNSLRRCIEVYSYNTRFCFVCNYVTKIITPVVSRCSCHFLAPLDSASATNVLLRICQKEEVSVDDPVILTFLYENTRRDMRNAIFILQGLVGSSAKHKTLTKEQVLEYFSLPEKGFWDTENLSFEMMRQKVEDTFQQGRTLQELLESLRSHLLLTSSSIKCPLAFVDFLSTTERKMIEGVSPRLLLMDLLLRFQSLSS